MDAPSNILVRMPNWVGDVVMATPALRALRRGFPEARITLLMKPHLEGVVEGLGTFDAVLPYVSSGPLGYWRLARRVRRGGFDLALVLPNSFNAAFLLRLAGVPRRVGYALNGRSALLTDAVPAAMQGWKRKPTYMGDYYLELCRRAGCPAQDGRLELAVGDAARREAAAALDENGLATDAPLVALCPGGAYGPAKLWPAERWAAVADALRERGCAVAVVHGPGEERLARAIRDAMQGDAPAVCRPFPVFKAIVERLALMICTDAGPRHVAVALGVPALVLMGPNSRAYTDGNLETSRILQKDLPCMPCQRKVCPTGDDRCMRAIAADEVVAAAGEMLAAAGQRGGPRPALRD